MLGVRGRLAPLVAVAIGASAVAAMPSASAATGSITGVAFQDGNRNGVVDPGEATFSGHRIYLKDTVGTVVAVATTDTAGGYRFDSVAQGSYTVQYAAGSWWDVRYGFAPTTTTSLRPARTISVPVSASVDFGWRPIVRSTDVSAPISEFTGTNGLRVESFNDVVPARDIYDAVMRGTVGPEASSVTIRFDYGTSSSTSTSAGTSSSGAFNSFAAVAYVSYESWLDQDDQTLSHEYGHAWSLYHAYLTQQDPSLARYLAARGLSGDPRVDSGYGWDRRELIAEDYRQLLGSSTARVAPQVNRDIPRAAEVPGLEQFLRSTWTSAGSTEPAPTPTPAPSSTPSLAVSDLSMAPTPVKRTGTVSFRLSTPAAVTVGINDANGARVRTLASSAFPAGTSTVTWDRLDDKNRKVRAGQYSVTVTATDSAGRAVAASAPFSVA